MQNRFFELDFCVSIDNIRKHLNILLKNTNLWDGRVKKVQVVKFQSYNVKIRILISAKDSSDLWNLKCYLNENIMIFLQN